MLDYSSHYYPYISDEQHGNEYSPDIENTLRSFKADIKSCKSDNDNIIESWERISRSQEKKVEVNAIIL